MGDDKTEKKRGQKEKDKEPDITFYHPALFEVPQDGSPPFLKGYRCKQCGQLDFPKLSICPGCWGEEFEMVPLGRRGTLYAFAEVFLGQPGMTYPMTIGYVDLPENIRVFAQLDGVAAGFKCNDTVELTIGTIRMNRDGLPVTSYKFKKAAS